MSLGFALDMTLRGLMSTSSRISLVSQNITNAGKTGYTRKEGSDIYVTTNAGTVPVKTNVVGSTDRYLTLGVVGDIGTKGYTEAITELMDYYAAQLGTTDGSTTMSGYLNSLYTAFQQLAASPETQANQTEVVQIAVNLADSLRNLSGDVQELRLQAEMKIADQITSVNVLLDKIHSINTKIVPGETADAQMAEHEDQRMAALEELAEVMDIQYYFTSQNQLQIFTSAGQPLLQSEPKHLSYETTTQVNANSTFQPILLNGVDITSTLRTGTLAGNIAIRDTILPEEQAKLDEFASVLKDQMNTLLNKGSSLPPQTSMTGSLQGLTAATPLAATGTFRVAIADNSGVLQNYSDINMAGITTVGDLLTALNAIPNVSASLDVNGALTINSTLAGSGLALSEMNSSVGPDSKGASFYFGLQDMFTGNGASFLNVSANLRNSPNVLATGALNSGAIAVGDTVLTRGDGSTSLAMAQILKSNVPFDAAGNFSAQNSTLARYMESIIANGATRASLAKSQYETANAIFSESKEALNNKTGVNIDEETANMLELQNHYEASARMVTTIRDLFQALLNAVS
ncbi:MAG: hypothetical protein DI586_02685 [Micavibrio aeruginosavorus]|uniref:Flagellar hook-associated protein 1 n=1 Tax=Micavibrio aeruginosavorus TaxID=349221 RepID=A0A2W5HM72_9BACT|nr:MAG: hypothetical protein DI586_02685 [Micavibrio aeruginosavorus]